MFYSLAITLIFALWYFVIGAVTGCSTGLVLAAMLERSKRGVWKDALLGGFGMILGFVLVAAVPVPQNTITYKTGETTVTSTENRFQHPYYIAFALAVAFPAIRAMRTAKRKSYHPSGA
jgi:NADH:ubiquinone oxidoreductase subunit 3 (subunit A)